MPLYNTSEEFKFLQCGTCGVHHAIPLAMYETKHNDGGYWHCPNGHQRGFRTSAEEEERQRIRRERDQLKQDAARLHDRIQEEKSRAEKAETKLAASMKRAKAGVCPCCNRTFENLRRHMASKHPNVVPLEQKQSAS